MLFPPRPPTPAGTFQYCPVLPTPLVLLSVTRLSNGKGRALPPLAKPARAPCHDLHLSDHSPKDTGLCLCTRVATSNSRQSTYSLLFTYRLRDHPLRGSMRVGLRLQITVEVDIWALNLWYPDWLTGESSQRDTCESRKEQRRETERP